MAHSHAHAAVRFTAQSVPHAQIGRPDVVGKSRAEKKNVAVQHEAGPSTSTPAPAGDIPSSLPTAAKSVAPQALPSVFNPSPDSLRACGAQAQIEAQLSFTGLEDLPKHSSFNFLVEGAPLHVLGEMR